MEFIFILERQFLVIKCLQENANYCVTLVMKTVIYKSKLLGFHDFESLVFDVFFVKHIVFLQTKKRNFKSIIKIIQLINHSINAGIRWRMHVFTQSSDLFFFPNTYFPHLPVGNKKALNRSISVNLFIFLFVIYFFKCSE